MTFWGEIEVVFTSLRWSNAIEGLQGKKLLENWNYGLQLINFLKTALKYFYIYNPDISWFSYLSIAVLLYTHFAFERILVHNFFSNVYNDQTKFLLQMFVLVCREFEGKWTMEWFFKSKNIVGQFFNLNLLVCADWTWQIKSQEELNCPKGILRLSKKTQNLLKKGKDFNHPKTHRPPLLIQHLKYPKSSRNQNEFDMQ